MPIPLHHARARTPKKATGFTGDEGQKLDHWGASLTVNIDLGDPRTWRITAGFRF